MRPKDWTMQISDQEVKLAQAAAKSTPTESLLKARPEDAELIQSVTQSVMEMSDREDLIADLKARVEAGTYMPSGEEIVNAMIRRSIADHLR